MKLSEQALTLVARELIRSIRSGSEPQGVTTNQTCSTCKSMLVLLPHVTDRAQLFGMRNRLLKVVLWCVTCRTTTPTRDFATVDAKGGVTMGEQ